MDFKQRIAKTLIWRIIAMIITYLISFALIGEVAVSVSVAVGANLVKTFAYYWYEFFWEKVR